MAEEPDVDLAFACNLPPKDAVAYFESKGLRVSRNWFDTWQAAHSRAFTVAGMARMDLLRAVRMGVKRALNEGKTEKWFIDTLLPMLQKAGWTGKRSVVNPVTGEVKEKGRDLPARLSLIYNQNLQQAYMTGQYRALLANAEARPYWQYIAILDSCTRPGHRALHGKVFRYDDPFWKTHYPPNGWHCRCWIRALTLEELQREKLIVSSGNDCMVSKDVVLHGYDDNGMPIEVTRKVWGYAEPGTKGLVHWTDPGFSYHPGAAAFGTDTVLAQKLELVKDARVYKQVVQAMNNAPARQAAFAVQVRNMLAGRKVGAAVVVGITQPEVVARAVAEGLDPARIVVMTDEKVKHAERGVHKRKSTTLSALQYQQLAKNFADPEAVYWDCTHKNAMYVFPDTEDDWCVILPVNMPTGDKKAAKKHGRLDGTATAYLWPRAEITKNINNGTLEKIFPRKDGN